MKEILKWLFENRMRDLEDEAFDYRMRCEERFNRNFIAEKKLRELGYELVFMGGTMAEPYGSPVRKDFKSSSWELRKISS